ncbi:Holliday junction resolvase RuvX [Sporomusa acidovorans]|uniref:Putative pre-16S rRNA nuclease n=1 Tax=Sporomusa acidovorans (strain ATCC 49682 / DSM 3132 / Mol) TaxID=1123286 RepID=A0ABZ3J486_SPOA4|nr:Holliday junction resolvase RuvX [Sporomusa acidovorans]OZC20860.1 putative holliday junction resolvase [Sporomusa acidovorans DSM 3132]SDE59467.1 putative holliday junction resolvase [Sporomusa acidovorans]
MRILALDVGDKTIGVAVCDELKLTAQGVEVIRRTSPTRDFKRLSELIDQYQVGLVIIGLPKNMNGTIGPRGELVKEFAKALVKAIPNIDTAFWDERLSTVAAQKSLIAADVSRAKRRQVIDKMAAVFILQGYLDSLPRG